MMLNELKNALKASTSHAMANHAMSRQSPAVEASAIPVMVWTISGIVLASCGGGDGGGPTVTGPGPVGRIGRVVDGPVEGAAVYFDMNGDGQVSNQERAAQMQDGRPMYITDANGHAIAPLAFEGRLFIADVDGAIDTATGDMLSGEYKSLPAGGIATPITDLIMDRIEPGGSDASAQRVLDDIFGTADLVTVADIGDAENYKIQETEVENPTLPPNPTLGQQARYDQDLAEYKISIIMKAALALSEIDKDDAFPDLAGATDRVIALKQIFDNDPSNDNQALAARVSERVDAGREILDGKPLALPDRNIDPINENSTFSFPRNSKDIFGFYDPNGNSDNAAPSRFTGIYVRAEVDFSQADDANHRVNLLYRSAPLSGHQVARSDSLPDNLPPAQGFYYVSYENLSRLQIRPSPDDHGELELEYYVFDGERWSDKAHLEIIVRDVAEVEVYEKAPLYKPIEIDSVDLEGYQLTERYIDNAFFTIDADGQLRWRTVPDHEVPRDSDSDNAYQIELFRPGPDGATDRIQVEIRVQDIGLDPDPGRGYAPGLFFLPVHIADDDLPDSGIQRILHGFAWKMPETGPLVVTYWIDTAQLATIYSGDQGRIDQFHSSLDATLLSFEQAANLKFIEVARNQGNEDIPHIELTFPPSSRGSSSPSRASTSSTGSVISFSEQDALNTPDYHRYIIAHEIGHALGLAHPFSSETGGHFNSERIYGTDHAWPGDEIYRLSPLTVMSYNRDVYGLQRDDIEALQFLYGAPGTNFMGVESVRQANAFAIRLGVRAQLFDDIDDHIDLRAGRKVADITITDPDGGVFGTLEVAGRHANFFEIRNRELWLAPDEGASLENIAALEVHVRIAEKQATHTDDITITVNNVNGVNSLNNVNDNIPEIARSGGPFQLNEGRFSRDTDTGYRYTASDADGGTSTLSLSGDDRFQLDRRGNLQIKASSAFDYENPLDRSITLTITAADSGVGSGNQPVSAIETVTITFENLNDNTPEIARSGGHIQLSEGEFSRDTNTGYRYTASDADGGTSRLTLSGDNRFKLNEDGDLQIKADSMFDYDNRNDRAITLTITAADSGVGLGARTAADTETVTITFRDVTDTPSEVSIEIYESHPLYRPIAIDSLNLRGYQLTEGYGDNALFTIDEDGQVRWKAVSDYEAPRDSDGDNIYKIELWRMDDGQTDRIEVDIKVKDIGIGPLPEEDYVPRFLLVPTDLADEDLPRDFIQHLFTGDVWKLPATGPVTIQYSLDAEELATFYNNDQVLINHFYSILDFALLSFEQAANIKFIEVAHDHDDDDVPYVYLEFSPDIFSIAYPLEGYKDTRIVYSTDHIGPEIIRTNANAAQRVIIHELGHALGLNHPFDVGGIINRSGLIWPGDEMYRESALSIMSYNLDLFTLQPADIEALRYLYGAPGTNFMGVERLKVESQFAREIAIGMQDLTRIDVNTDLTAGIKVADIRVTDEDGGAFGTLETAGEHAAFFEIRNGLELWLVLEAGASLENITALEVYLRLEEKNGTRTDDITITVTDAGSSEATGSSGPANGALSARGSARGSAAGDDARDTAADIIGDADQIKIDETVDEGQREIANLIDLELGEIDLTAIMIGGDDKGHVEIRQTQNGRVLEFVSAPDFEAPEDDDGDNVYEITLYDDLASIEVDITVIDIPEL